jgi:hypothetical protein
MKKFEFKISHFAIDSFFPKARIKTKLQVLEILMEATRYILVNPEIDKNNIAGKIILLIDKMSRLFFLHEGKYYSIVFPFLTRHYDNKLLFSFQNEVEIDSQLISNILSIIKGSSFNTICSLDFADSIYNFETEYNENFWVFLRELLLHEDGYIRYDKDLTGYLEAKTKGEERKHPLNHFDVCYSSSATYKIGIDRDLSEGDFVDLLDIKTDCRYLKY